MVKLAQDVLRLRQYAGEGIQDTEFARSNNRTVGDSSGWAPPVSNSRARCGRCPAAFAPTRAGLAQQGARSRNGGHGERGARARLRAGVRRGGLIAAADMITMWL